jgi:hypothetical protein
METTATIDCLRLNPFGGTFSATSPNLKAFFRTQGWSCDSSEAPVGGEKSILLHPVSNPRPSAHRATATRANELHRESTRLTPAQAMTYNVICTMSNCTIVNLYRQEGMLGG